MTKKAKKKTVLSFELQRSEKIIEGLEKEITQYKNDLRINLAVIKILSVLFSAAMVGVLILTYERIQL